VRALVDLSLRWTITENWWCTVCSEGSIIAYGLVQVCESTVCLEYLDEVYDHAPKLYPGGPVVRARARIWIEHVNRCVVQ
jgi:hypothetical protein